MEQYLRVQRDVEKSTSVISQPRLGSSRENFTQRVQHLESVFNHFAASHEALQENMLVYLKSGSAVQSCARKHGMPKVVSENSCMGQKTNSPAKNRSMFD